MGSDRPNPPATQHRVQFRLRGLLIAVALFSALLAIGSQIGAYAAFFVAAIVCVVAAFVFRQAWVQWLIASVACLALTFLLLPALQGSRYSPSAHCRNNLKQIGLALQMYHTNNGCYPPAYITDDQGRPMHSWRTLILPYLERNDLLLAYRFDEPWDGPNNRRLERPSRGIFQCPSRSDPRDTVDYLAVIGPGTMWPGAESFDNSQIRDDPAKTILLVEVLNSDVDWFEPRDLHVSQLSPHVNPAHGQGISSFHLKGAHVLMADGSVLMLEDGITPENLRALVSPRGGEVFDPGRDQP